MAKGHIAGFYHAQFALRNSDGYPCGTVADVTSIANGTEMHAYKLTAPVESTALTFPREAALFRGGQQILGRRMLGITDVSSFDITLSAFDETFHTLVTGSAIDTTIASSNSVTTANANLADPPQGILLLTVGFQTTDGANKYMTYGYPNVQIAESSAGAASQAGGENPNPTRYTVTVSSSTRTIFGLPFSATTLGAENDADFMMRYVTTLPVALSSFKADTSDTSFLVGYRPAVSEHAGARNVFTKNGAQGHTDVSGVNTTTGAITISSATAADFWVALYETNFTAI